MNEIIKIETHEGKRAVNARELHERVGRINLIKCEAGRRTRREGKNAS